MVVAEPPEPVAAFRDEHLLPGVLDGLGSRLPLRFGLFEELTRLVEQVPGGIVFVMSDPDREVVRDPASRVKIADAVGRRLLFEIVANPLRPNLGVLHAASVERAEKADAAVRVIFP